MSDPTMVTCPVCGEAPGRPCREYSAIPFRSNKTERRPEAMRDASRTREPHEARVALAELSAIRSRR